MEQQTTQNQPSGKKRSKRFLVGYSIALFLFASVLILFSYFSQARLEQEANQAKLELSKKTEVAAGFESRLEQVTAINAKLEESVKTLESTVETLNEELSVTKSDLSATSYAYEILWKLIKAEDEGDRAACKSYLKQASELDMETLLSEAGFAEFKRIKSKFEGA